MITFIRVWNVKEKFLDQIIRNYILIKLGLDLDLNQVYIRFNQALVKFSQEKKKQKSYTHNEN